MGVMRKTRSVMEHVVTYVETYLVRFIQDTFHTRRDRLEVESVKTASVQRDFSRLEYDFQSKPIVILNRHSRHSLTILNNRLPVKLTPVQMKNSHLLSIYTQTCQ